MVKPDRVVGEFVKDFNFNEMMGFKGSRMSSSEESSSMESTNFLANMSTFIFMFFIAMTVVIFMAFLMCVCKDTIAITLKNALIKFKNDTFFGNSIKA